LIAKEVPMACPGLRSSLLLALASSVTALAAGTAAAEKPSFDVTAAAAGSAVFKTYCAVCHGPKGRGDGPLAESLRFAPADLTRIALRNRGKFSFDDVHRIVDGRSPLKGHGGPDMPVWGDAFLQSREGYDRDAVKKKIGDVVQFLASIQE
jgi:mono/diheme cytochrome c family protein